MNLQDLVNQMTCRSHDFEPEEADYEIVAWNGKERVKLSLDGIDRLNKVIVLITEDFYQEVNPEELNRRIALDRDSTVNTIEDAEAYMADVLARGPIA